MVTQKASPVLSTEGLTIALQTGNLQPHLDSRTLQILLQLTDKRLRQVYKYM